MPPEPIPDRGPDEEPDDSSLPSEEWDGPEECLPEECLPEQGLFVCLPAEELTLEGFAEDGRADTMEPGPLLATVVGAVTGDDARGLKGTSDDQLTGILSASLRLESRDCLDPASGPGRIRRPPPGQPRQGHPRHRRSRCRGGRDQRVRGRRAGRGAQPDLAVDRG